MIKKSEFYTVLFALGIVFALMGFYGVADAKPGNRGDLVIYVTSQELYYDSILAAPMLPPHGPFQLLEPTAGPGGIPQTEFGPGDRGYVGGRWWVDVNGNTEMDEEDAYFSCPLLGPGRETP